MSSPVGFGVIEADPDELMRCADRLQELASQVTGRARSLTALTVGSPVAARLALTVGSLVLIAAALEELSLHLRLVAVRYRVADSFARAGTATALTLFAAPLLVLGGDRGVPTMADAVRGLAVLLRPVGWLHESALVGVRPRPVAWAGPPGGLGDVVGRIPTTGAPVVHIERLSSPGGGRRWLVTVPGTVSWSPRAAREPFDLTGDVSLMARVVPSAGMAGVVAAMRAVGVRKGEPVMVAGHSQGGLIAASLAADTAVRREFSITEVVGAGAPIALVPVPRSVGVLAIEHTTDPVPLLDGQANPPAWLTVRTPAPAGASPLTAHRGELYFRTASRLDSLATFDPALAAWQRSAAPFLTATTGEAWNVEVERLSPKS